MNSVNENIQGLKVWANQFLKDLNPATGKFL